jgi:uncharacterized protein (TIGR00266 family)
MEFQINGNPDYGELTCALAPGEKCVAESGAMSRMSRSMDLRGRMMGGLFSALGRKIFGGESLFVGEYSAAEGGWISFAPNLPGSVTHHHMDNGNLILTAGSFLACSPGIKLSTKFGGWRYLFGGEGGFFLEASGSGDLFYNTYGALVEKEINGSITVDTGHVVAWDPNLSYTVTGMGGLKQTLFSGEGLVLKFSGRGKIWLQTRTLKESASWLSPFCSA